MGERLADDKWVRVMCDYCADGLWAKDGCAVSSDELPVSRGTRALLREWQDWFEAFSESYIPAEERTKSFDVAAFSDFGKIIAHKIKDELPDWTVIYFDEAKSEFSADRSTFEYEITGRVTA